MASYPGALFLSALHKYASILVDYSVHVGKGEEVAIRGTVEALPLLKEIYRTILEKGAYPTLLISDDTLTEIFYKHASEDHLKHISPITRVLYEEYDVFINILSPTHTKTLVGIDPAKQALMSQTLRPLNERFFKEAAEGKKKWTVAPYPTLAMAQEAGMSPGDFEEFVYRALKLDEEDPVKAWREQSERQKRLIEELLSKADELRFQGPGIDLTVKVGGRRWISDDGHENMPGGEVFTGPVEDSVDGCVEFDYPAVYRGVEVEGVKLCFRNGRVYEYSAVKGRDFLEKMVNLDEGSARLGELAFGLNYSITRATKEILFDEKIGGTVHMALGAGYPETGSQNKSAIHWDMIKDMKSPEARVYVDGELAYRAGRFLLW